MAEAGGFEPPRDDSLAVFKTGAFGRSATPPWADDPIRAVGGVQRGASVCHVVQPDGSTNGSNAAIAYSPSFYTERGGHRPKSCTTRQPAL